MREVRQRIRKGGCNGCNGCQEEGRRMREGTTRILTRIHGWVFLLITNYRQHYRDFDTDTRMGVFCFYRLPTARYGF
ncbi:hypothetical protein QUB61_20120 [Microcoleus sp. C2D2]